MPGVLGISPGTQSMGIAVLKEGRLAHWKIQKFQGAWDHKKRRTIVHFLSQQISRNKVEAIAVKIPDVLPISDGYIQLLGAMNVLFERKGIKAVYYTLSDLKKHYCLEKKINKKALTECIVAKHPELLLEYRKEQNNRNPYYHKLFEAVAVAQVIHRTCLK